MQSNNKNSKQIISNNKDNEVPVEKILIENVDVLNRLVQENITKKERSFISAEEYDLMQKLESNLIYLIRNCPSEQFKEIFAEIHKADEGDTKETSKEEEGEKRENS